MSKLQSARWDVPANSNEPLPFQMVASDATGFPLVKLGAFGADLTRFAPGKQVGPHTHPGDHILICVRGDGVLWYDGEEHRIDPGFIYLVPGNVPHAVYARPDATEPLVLFAIGNDHQIVDSPARLEVVDTPVEITW
jgi:quercetin dioxygenase-like cupin family protein